MKNRVLFSWMLFSIFILESSYGQNISINDSLAANSDMMKVKLQGQGAGKMWKMKFGDYAVESSKAGATVTTTKSNLFNTYAETKSKQKFSFILTDKNDTAYAYGAKNVEVKELRAIDIIPEFSVGTNQILESSDVISTFININQDSTDTWTLLIRHTGSSTEKETGAILTNGKESFIIHDITSGPSDKRSLPAQGYEFYKDSVSLAAVQYYGGGALGLNKNIVWISKNVTDKMKLILAASATVLINNAMSNYSMME